ncbi:MAG: hypothetical protein AWU54_784 [Candidatus Frackibacter sp. T328-2]|nr:MAG: hypothetical protein AWU54_784 [Candidatus Frackibacter sp. T328-2]
MKNIIKNAKKINIGINGLFIKIAITFFMSPFLFTNTVYAANDLTSIIDNFLTALQTPLRIGAGLGLLFGLFQLVMSFKEDNPQAKSSAIKFLIGAAALYLFAENFIDWIGVTG